MNSIEQSQKNVCERAGSACCPTQPDEKVGIAMSTLASSPIYGVRRSPTEGVAGWYIWGGEYSSAPDFFQPVHVAHLGELIPEVLSYLSLAPGHKFIIDREGYEDIWFDDSLLKPPGE